MKHILLTGATGFLGSYLLGALLSRGYQVTVIKRSTSDISRVKKYIKNINCINVDEVEVDDIFKHSHIDAIIHTACNYGRNGESDYVVLQTNLQFGLSLLDAAISYNVRVFINTDTSLPRNLNAYSLSKKQFSDWLRFRSNKIKVCNVIPELIYGASDDKTKFVTWLIDQLQRGVDRIPLTKGDEVRNFIYITDVVSAYLAILDSMESLLDYTEFDVCFGESVSVKKFVDSVYTAYKKLNPSIKTTLGYGDIPMRDNKDLNLNLNNKPLLDIGWRPLITIDEGIQKVINDE